jgi:hypothetical protein
MSNVIQLRPNLNIPTALRNIADSVENGALEGDDCTLILGLDVFHLGNATDENAAPNAIFNMTYGIQKLMRPVLEVDND